MKSQFTLSKHFGKKYSKGQYYIRPDLSVIVLCTEDSNKLKGTVVCCVTDDEGYHGTFKDEFVPFRGSITIAQ